MAYNQPAGHSHPSQSAQSPHMDSAPLGERIAPLPAVAAPSAGSDQEDTRLAANLQALRAALAG